MRRFKVWNRTGKFWIEDDIDSFVEIDWTIPGHDNAGECFVKAKPLMNVEIIWQDNDGDYCTSAFYY